MNWPRWIIVNLGLWLAFAPFALGYSGTEAAVSNGIVVGLVIVIVSVWHKRAEGTRVAISLSWGIILLGVWVLLAPFVLRYHTVGVAGANDIFVGATVIVLAWLQGAATERRSRPRRETVDRGNNATLAGRTITFLDWTVKKEEKNSERRLTEDLSSIAEFWGHSRARLTPGNLERHRALAEVDRCPCRQEGGEKR